MYEYGVPILISKVDPRKLDHEGRSQGFMFEPRFHHRIPCSYTYSYTQISFMASWKTANSWATLTLAPVTLARRSPFSNTLAQCPTPCVPGHGRA